MANYNSSHTGAEIDSAVGRTKDTVVTAGTVAASSAVVVDANKDISGFRNVTLTGQIQAATINLTGDTTIGDGDTDNITINADVNSNIIPNTDNTFDLGSSSKQWKDIYVNGIGYIDQLGTDADPIAIYASSGEIDGTAIGSESASTGAFTTLTASGDVNFDSNTLFVDASQNGVSVGSADPLGYGLNIESSNALRIKGADSSSNYHIRVLDSASNVDFVVRGDGNVGIGTASPARTLDVVGDIQASSLIKSSVSSNSTNLATANGGTLILENSHNTDGNFSNIGGYNTNGLVSSQINFVNVSQSSRHGAITLNTHNGSSLTERVRVDKDGNVGIDQTSPSSFYSGASNLVIGNTSQAESGLTIVSSGGASSYGEIFFADGTTGNQAYRGFIQYNHDNSTDSLLFGTAGSERMRIDSSGNVGIGGTPTDKFQINYDANFYDVFNGAGNWTTKRGNGSTGGLVLATDLSSGSWGSGGGYIEFKPKNSTAMKITGDGNVGIGTTSPDRAVTIYRSGGIGARLDFQTNDTGTGDQNGTEIGVYQNNMNAFIWNYENSDIYFGANNTERMRILSGGGITFNGDTATANALDDYEEGTWTPVINRITVSPTVSYSSNRYGAYTKIGNMVFASFDVTFNSISGGSGSAILSGLPFTVSDTNNKFAGYSVLQQRAAGGVAAGGSGQQLSGFAQRNAAYLYLQYDNSGTSGYDSGTGASWNSSGRFTGYIMYIAA